jgi:hypothetical protein
MAFLKLLPEFFGLTVTQKENARSLCGRLRKHFQGDEPNSARLRTLLIRAA